LDFLLTLENTAASEIQLHSGIIYEYVSLTGVPRSLVIIDSGQTGMKMLAVDKARIAPLLKDFPVGSDVVVYRSDDDGQYIFRKPEA
jgi:hypothetical protein